MRLFGILLLLCFTFGTVSALTLPSWLPSIFQNPYDQLINKICSYLQQHPDRAATALQKINEALQKNAESQDTFNATLQYINSPMNQMSLVGGLSTCPSFFSGLQDAISTDLKNKKATEQQKKPQAIDIITDALTQLKALFN